MFPLLLDRFLPKLTLQTEGAKPLVWDPIRKSWLVLQPEESVRQALLIYLLEEKGVPETGSRWKKSFWSTAFPEEQIF